MTLRPRVVFDVATLASVALIATGTGLQWGIAIALIVTGTLTLLLAGFAAYLGLR
jgi:hypothetical protein